MYRQCELKRDGAVDVRWIPIEVAKKGKTIIVKETGEEWLVSEVYSTIDKDRSRDNEDFKKVEVAGRKSYKVKGN